MPHPSGWLARVTRLRQDVELLRKAGVLVVVVTGSRNWVNHTPVLEALRRLLNKPGLRETRDPRSLLIVHGDARGLDRIAGALAANLGMNVLKLPAPWSEFGKLAGRIRNQAMIKLPPDLVLGFPLGESRGTRDCLARAVSANIATIVVEG